MNRSERLHPEQETKKIPELNMEEWLSAVSKRVDGILQNHEQAIINLSGASASGKGYSAEKLKASLENQGKRVLLFSTDDFYKGISAMMCEEVSQRFPGCNVNFNDLAKYVRGVTEHTEFSDKFSDDTLGEIDSYLRENHCNINPGQLCTAFQEEFGEIDFDNPKAVDLNKVNEILKTLTQDPSQETTLSNYSMVTGENSPGASVKGEDFDVILVEGLYSLNDQTLDGIPETQQVKTFIESDLKTLLMRRCRRDIIGKRVSMPPETTLFITLEVVIPAYLRHILPDKEKADLILKSEFTPEESSDTKDLDVQDKIRISEQQATEIRERLGGLQRQSEQEDWYFSNSSIMENQDHLIRLRTSDGHLESLVHKSTLEKRSDGKLIRPTEKYLEEKDFGSIYDNPSDLETAFRKAGFRLAAKMHKVRSSYDYGPLQVVIDDVDGLGTYLELRSNNQRDLSDEIDRFKAEFNITSPSSGPYIDEYLKMKEKENSESEKKYILSHLPDGLSSPYLINQYYLNLNRESQKMIEQYFPTENIDWGNISEARLRRKSRGNSDEFFLTLKSPGTERRGEFECPIEINAFEEFMAFYSGKSLQKIRSTIQLDEDKLLEVDQYLGSLQGLIIGEVEFDSDTDPQIDISKLIEEKTGIVPHDVTDDPQYKNFILSEQ